MEAEAVEKTVENNAQYVFSINGRTLKLDRDMVDRYADLVCPVDERYLSNMIDIFGNKKFGDDVLSLQIALDMAREVGGYER